MTTEPKIPAIIRKLFSRYSQTDQSFPRTLGGVKTTNLSKIGHLDTIVLVLGQSGSGKSTFITKIVGCDVGIGSDTSQEPKTKNITAIRVVLARDSQNKGDLILVDTPCIERGQESKEQEMISNWCKQAGSRGLSISGVLYFMNLRNIKRRIPVETLLLPVGMERKAEKIVLVLSMEAEAVHKDTLIDEWKAKQGDIETIGFFNTMESALDIMKCIASFTPDPSCTRPKDIVIAVMGPTGSGKSTFISKITNDPVEIGHKLQSCTNSVNLIRVPGFTPFGGDRVFVDTPGFDDTYLSDVDILKMISDWLNKSYGDGVRLSGLLYFHRISDNRMAGTPLKNLRMFQELCGKNMFQSIVLVTTMWDDVDEETGINRETELKANYWGGMISLGSRTARFDRRTNSPLEVIDLLFEASVSTKEPPVEDIILLLQEEMNVLKRELPETSAGQQLISKLESLLSKRRELLDRISGDVAESRAEGDEDSVEILMQELEKLQQQMTSTMQEMDRMALPKNNLSIMSRLLHGINSIRG